MKSTVLIKYSDNYYWKKGAISTLKLLFIYLFFFLLILRKYSPFRGFSYAMHLLMPHLKHTDFNFSAPGIMIFFPNLCDQ